MNYYPHNIGDYRAATAHLSLLEHGIYRQLLDWYYLDEKPIPSETNVVFRRLCARTEEEQKSVLVVLSDYFSLSADGYSHHRCDKEIALYQGKAERARDNGKLGGRPKKTEVVISGLAEETDSKANQEPITNNQEPKKNKKQKTAPVASLSAADLMADGLSQDAADELIALRVQKRAPLTAMSWKGCKDDIGKAGMTLQAGVEHWIKTGWQAFYAPKEGQGSARGSPASKLPSAHNDFSKRDYRAGINADGTF